MINRHYKVIIIGGGPAGCSAAIQLERQGINTKIIEKGDIGGLAKNANNIENILGFPEGITGEEFCGLLETHLKNLEIEVFNEKVVNIDWNVTQTHFVIDTKNKQQYTSQYLIVATGTKPKKLKIKNEKDLRTNNFLFYEPSQIPANLLSDKKVLIIGGGDAAFDYALNLADKGNHIIIAHRSNKFNCLPILYNRVLDTKNINIKTFVDLKEVSIEKNKGSEQLNILFKQGDKLKADYIIGAIGREPTSINSEAKLKRKGAKSNLYLIGDLVNKSHRQISISAGDGIKTAMIIAKEIKDKKK